MKKILFALIFISYSASGQSLYPLLDSTSISKGLTGTKDIRFRTIKNGSDPLKDIRLQDLFKAINPLVTGGDDSCQIYHVLDGVGSVSLSCDTSIGNDIKISDGYGITLYWQTDTSFSIVNSLPDQVVSIASGTGINVTGTYPSFTVTNTSTNTDNQTLSLLAGGGTLKLTKSGSASDFVQLRDSSATNEIQTLSIFAGKGTIKLTNPGSVSTFIQLADSSATNEIELPTQTGNGGKFLTTNGTVVSWGTVTTGTVTSVGMTVPTGLSVTGSPITTSGTFAVSLANDLAALEGLSSTGYAVRTGTDTWAQRSFGVNAGQLTVANNTGVAGNTSFGLATTPVSPGTYGSGTMIPIFTVDQFGRLTAANNTSITETQTLSLLSGGGTLKLTKPGSLSDFVQLKDSTISNEGVLSVQAGTATTSIIRSNSSTSPDITIEVSGPLTTTESGNKITLGSSGLTSINEAKKSDRLGSIVVSDSIGFDFKKLVKDDFPDSLMFVFVFDSTTNTNKKVSMSYFDYDPYAQATGTTNFTLSLAANVDSTLRLPDEGLGYLFTYSASTGEFQYIGGRTIIVKIDANVSYRFTDAVSFESKLKLWHQQAGSWTK